VTRDERLAMLDQLAIDQAKLQGDMAERQRRSADPFDPLYGSLERPTPVITKDAHSTGIIRKIRDNALVQTDDGDPGLTEEELDAAISVRDALKLHSIGIDVVADEAAIVQRALEDQIANLEAAVTELRASQADQQTMIDLLIARIDELESQSDGGANGA
jgi:hypothetical protein